MGLLNKKFFTIFTFDNEYNPLNVVARTSCMKSKNAKKDLEKTDTESVKEQMHEQMLEQTHQLELEKNYESDEKFDESAE